MKVDVIIPTYKPDDLFCLLLQKLQEQTFVVHRLIVMNTDENLWEKAKRAYPIEERLNKLPCPWSLMHVTSEEFDHGETRLRGAKASDADIILFMTQDAVPADNRLIEYLAEEFSVSNQEGGEIAVAYARQLPREDCSIIERYTRQFNYPEDARLKYKADLATLGIKTYFCSDVCAAYRRDLFFLLGGFEYPVIFNEDMFFAAKAIEAGYGIKYAAKAKVIHSHNYSVRQQFRRNFDLAVSQTMHPEIFEGVSSEAEGIRLVKNTIAYLWRLGKPYLIWELGWQCIGKYAGFFLGKRYHRLGKRSILRCTMNQPYWKRVWKEEE
ncbi:MAG: glycosyltransferase family 2 protein [Roseburia sp.]